jgi:hypothetical protein
VAAFKIDVHADQVGCLVLVEPFFLDESEWIAPPADWAPNIVQGKRFDSDIGEGARIWRQVQLALARRLPMEHAVAEHRYGKPILVQPRLGQGAFRLLVTDAYERRCAVTGERTLPVLDAAHIRPYAELGPHKLENGILLRKDLHALFDAGYVTVTPSLELASAAASAKSSRTAATTTPSRAHRSGCRRRRHRRPHPSTSSGTVTRSSAGRLAPAKVPVSAAPIDGRRRSAGVYRP